MSTAEVITLLEAYKTADKAVLKSNIIKYIKESKKYLKNTQALANDIGVSLQTVHAYKKIKGGCLPDAVSALKLCEALCITIEDLITEKK